MQRSALSISQANLMQIRTVLLAYQHNYWRSNINALWGGISLSIINGKRLMLNICDNIGTCVEE